MGKEKYREVRGVLKSVTPVYGGDSYNFVVVQRSDESKENFRFAIEDEGLLRGQIGQEVVVKEEVVPTKSLGLVQHIALFSGHQ